MTYVDSALLEMIGRSFEDVLGDGWIQWLSPEVRNLQERTWRSGIAAGEPFERRHTYLTALGERRTVCVRANPIKDEAGTLQGWAGVHLEEPASPSVEVPKSPVESFFESTTDAFVAFDTEFRFTYANRVASEMLQRKPEELIGISQWELFPQLVGTKVELEFRRAMREQTAIHFEFAITQADIWLQIHAYPSPSGLAVYFRDISERKRAEARLALALQGARASIWEWDLATDLMTWSREMHEITGIPSDVAPSRTVFFERIDPADQKRIYMATVKAVDETSELNEEILIRNMEGEARWISLRATVVRNEAGKAIRFVGLAQNITERRQAEEELRDARRSLSLALLGGRMGYWSRSVEPDVIKWSPELEALFGLEPGAFAGDKGRVEFEKLVHPDDVERVAETVRKALRTGEDYRMEFRFRHADGGWRWMEGRGRASFDASGKPAWVHGVGIDITESKEIEARYERLANLVPCLVWVLDGKGYTRWVNRRWTEVTGLPGLQPTPDDWLALIHPEDLEPSRKIWWDCLRNGTPYEAELRYRTKNGEYRWFLERGEPILGGDGEVTEWFGTSVDIHDQKTKEQTLALADRRQRELNQELEARVETRTAELVDANREMEGFTYTVSHDLRAPLRAIMSTSMILLEETGGKLSPEERSLLERQAHNAKHLGVLIDELLKLSRISRQDMKFVRFDLSDLTAQVARELVDGFGEHVSLEIDPSLEAVGDPKLVKFVLLNLLENAVKFSPNGGTVRVGARDGTFFVKDEGIGFDPRYRDKLFRPFERLVSQSEYPGTGIGLANVKRIVERHGGKVWAESTPGHGSTFWFSLAP
ncbi:sensor histidine kinase, PAS, PAS, PAC, incomplete PAS and PAC domain-containing [Fimbriimonas ginsengisoli Gsoil 348]|uniref:histidine kinase n=1 Tax=Fimbriimonas ginsengisoli Gsoil 348 TaxID=661478 RepID=A0A068NN60_FIMGI|nr:sensor histidine kinase, PAS, PAS, PAC, incomplete PAS and PAC domain-containing [Fimbriimonas ginsengisoli Gsoil 348]